MSAGKGRERKQRGRDCSEHRSSPPAGMGAGSFAGLEPQASRTIAARTMAASSRCLARSSKSRTAISATNKRATVRPGRAPSFGELLGGSAVAHGLDQAPGRYRWASVCTPRRRRYTSEGRTNNNRFLCRFKPGKKRCIFSADNTDFSDGFLYGPSKRAIRAP
jgi:hypothetical protein